MLFDVACKAADNLGVVAGMAEVPEDEVVSEGVAMAVSIALLDLTELESGILKAEETDCAIGIEVPNLFVGKAVSEKLVAASCTLALAALGAGDDTASFLGGVRSSEPSICL